MNEERREEVVLQGPTFGLHLVGVLVVTFAAVVGLLDEVLGIVDVSRTLRVAAVAGTIAGPGCMLAALMLARRYSQRR